MDAARQQDRGMAEALRPPAAALHAAARVPVRRAGARRPGGLRDAFQPDSDFPRSACRRRSRRGELPIGVQLVAPPGKDASLLTTAALLAAIGRSGRRNPVRHRTPASHAPPGDAAPCREGLTGLRNRPSLRGWTWEFQMACTNPETPTLICVRADGDKLSPAPNQCWRKPLVLASRRSTSARASSSNLTQRATGTPTRWSAGRPGPARRRSSRAISSCATCAASGTRSIQATRTWPRSSTTSARRRAPHRAPAAPALPCFLPAAAPDLTRFSREYFRELFAGLQVPLVLVFDNYRGAARFVCRARGLARRLRGNAGHLSRRHRKPPVVPEASRAHALQAGARRHRPGRPRVDSRRDAAASPRRKG